MYLASKDWSAAAGVGSFSLRTIVGAMVVVAAAFQSTWGGVVTIPGCPGTSVEITSLIIGSGDLGICYASENIKLGPLVDVESAGELELKAPKVTLNAIKLTRNHLFLPE